MRMFTGYNRAFNRALLHVVFVSAVHTNEFVYMYHNSG